jgi:hypothetical protein
MPATSPFDTTGHLLFFIGNSRQNPLLYVADSVRKFSIFAVCSVLLTSTHVLCAAEAEPAAVFSGSQGNYAGFVQIGDGNFLNSGVLVAVVEATGRFTLNLTWRGFRYPIVGKFDAGTATFGRRFKDKGKANGTLVLNLVLDPPASRIIQSSLDIQEDGSTVDTATGELSGALPDSNVSETYQGTTNTAFMDPPSFGDIPQAIPGDGFSISRISKGKSRAIRMIGRLPDTASFSSGSLLRGSIFTLYTGLYRSKNGAVGNAYGSVDASNPNALFSTILWAKRPGANLQYYPAGFNTSVGLITSGYERIGVTAIPPISINPGPIVATLTLKGGNLPADITAQIKIGLSGVKVFNPNPQRIVLHTSAAGASWVGSFLHPNNNRRTMFHGGFTEVKGSTNGEGRGNFKGSVAANSSDLPESGSARIAVNP